MSPFKFKLDQKVTTPLGDVGIITMIGIDGEGTKYFIQTSNNNQWWKESQIEAV